MPPSDVEVESVDDDLDPDFKIATTDSSDELSSETFVRKTFKSSKHACPFPGCTMMFSRPFRLEMHKRIHTGERPYVCKEQGCVKAFTRSTHLRRHMTNSHNKKEIDKNIENVKIDAEESSDDESEKPKTEKSFQCKSCPKQFLSKYSLNKHERVSHSGNVKRYPCKTCGQTFAKKTWLNVHLASHNGEFAHKCEKCGRSFSAKNKLERHMSTHDYKCSTCNLNFNNFGEFRKHKSKEHVGKDKKTCPICEKEFKNRSQLRQHYVVHSDVRDVYRCTYPMCSRTYFQERNLKQHVQAYHENKRFSCSFAGCDSKLATRGKLTQHMKAMHENQKRPKISKKPKSHKKNPKKPIAALLTGAVLPRDVEREIIVEGKTFELSLPELSQEVSTLKSDSEMEDSGMGANLETSSHEVSVQNIEYENISNFKSILVKDSTESGIGTNDVDLDPKNNDSQSINFLMSPESC